jgi:hypothetical protein
MADSSLEVRRANAVNQDIHGEVSAKTHNYDGHVDAQILFILECTPYCDINKTDNKDRRGCVQSRSKSPEFLQWAKLYHLPEVKRSETVTCFTSESRT